MDMNKTRYDFAFMLGAMTVGLSQATIAADKYGALTSGLPKSQFHSVWRSAGN